MWRSYGHQAGVQRPEGAGAERSGAERSGAERRLQYVCMYAVNSAAERRRGAAAQSTACAVRAPRNGARSAHSIRRTRDTMKVKSCQVI